MVNDMYYSCWQFKPKIIYVLTIKGRSCDLDCDMTATRPLCGPSAGAIKLNLIRSKPPLFCSSWTTQLVEKFHPVLIQFIILTDLLKVEPHTPTSEPAKYERKDGQWYTHNGVDIQDTQQRKG